MSNVAVVSGVLVILMIYILLFGVIIANYVLTSLGLYRLASRSQVKEPWWAWIPVVSDLLVGRITEKCDERNGIQRKWSTVMLILSLIYICGGILFFISYFGILFTAMVQTSAVAGNVTGFILSLFFIVFVLVLIWALAATAYACCSYVCMYKILESIAPEKALKYFLLSILVPLAYGIILIKLCKKDPGESVEDQPLNMTSEEISSEMEML